MDLISTSDYDSGDEDGDWARSGGSKTRSGCAGVQSGGSVARSGGCRSRVPPSTSVQDIDEPAAELVQCSTRSDVSSGTEDERETSRSTRCDEELADETNGGAINFILTYNRSGLVFKPALDN